jgi:hypothetical protein
LPAIILLKTSGAINAGGFDFASALMAFCASAERD